MTPLKNRLKEIRERCGCLIPREGVAAPSCHEFSNCDCTTLALLDSLEIALGALDKLREGWLYWPAKNQSDSRTVLYNSETVDNIERMAREAIARIQERMGR